MSRPITLSCSLSIGFKGIMRPPIASNNVGTVPLPGSGAIVPEPLIETHCHLSFGVSQSSLFDSFPSLLGKIGMGSLAGRRALPKSLPRKGLA